MKFGVYGPFLISRTNRIITKHDIRALWEDVENGQAGLTTACGCYVFATQGSGGPALKIWYVGKTEKKTFIGEVFNHSNIVKYNELLSGQQRAKPMLFLLPQITGPGKFKTSGVRPAIRELESILIGMAINQNSKLLNIRGTKWIRKLSVSGFLNAPLAKSGPSKELRNAFGR